MNTTATAGWTFVYRAPRGRYFRPVAGVPAGMAWSEAHSWGRTELGHVAAGDLWLVPDQQLQASSWPEDRDNVLVDSGRRFPIRWDAPALQLQLPAPSCWACGSTAGTEYAGVDDAGNDATVCTSCGARQEEE